MASRKIKFTMRDDYAANFKTAVLTAEAPETGSMLEPKHEFAKFKKFVLMTVRYDEFVTPHGPLITNNDGIKFATANILLSGANGRHNPIGEEDICDGCEDIDLHRMFGRLAGRKYQLGRAAALFKCVHCSLCRILTASFALAIGKGSDQLASDLPHSVVILTDNWSILPVPKSGERPQHIRAFLLNEMNSLIEADIKIRLLADDAEKISKTPEFMGRMVEPEKWNVDLAIEWLKECEGEHGCLRRGSGGLQSATNAAPTKSPAEVIDTLLVVDTKSECIVPLPQHSRYATLSYVWPRFEALQLKRQNFKQLQMPGSLMRTEPALPNVLKDAINIARDLAERYIWIDALCIVQDDLEMKGRLVGRMHRIYGDSFLNIIIASATSPEQDYSCPGVGAPKTRGVQVIENVQGVRLITALPDYNGALENTVWSTRGWTFQEGLLSRRCLVLTENQMYFRCAQDSRCEDVLAEYITHTYDAHPARPKQRQTKVDFLASTRFLSSITKKDTFGEYALLVKEYSQRNLSFEDDILPAFTGIVLALQSHTHDQGFYWGLSLYSFHRALLWYPISPNTRRKSVKHTHESHVLVYPSWSWVSWVGGVDYEADHLHLGDDYQHSILPMAAWHRYCSKEKSLVAVGPVEYDLQARNAFGLGALWSKISLLKRNPHFIISWAAKIRMKLQLPESSIADWTSDSTQSLPCFTIIDSDGRACGFLPSADRRWAKQYSDLGGGECDLILLSLAVRRGEFDQVIQRERFFNGEHYPIDDKAQFLNVMLVQYDEHGIAERRGCGGLHEKVLADPSRGEYRSAVEYEVLVLG